MSGPAASIIAQAKLNLHLRVLDLEPSGYHAIETIFHRIELGDEIRVQATDGERTIDVAGAETGPAEANLAYRAAAAYAAMGGWPRGYRIELNKRIPVGAGLGGGSSDAAAVLRVLDSLAPVRMGSHTMMSIAQSLGSDVPFLASDAVMALGSGRGELLSPLPPLARMDVLLMTPDFEVSTAEAYRWLDEDRAVPREVPESARGGGARAHSSWQAIAGWARNDFEPVIVARHAELGPMLAKLRGSRAIFAGMTGSGSTIFGILDGPADFAKVPAEYRHRVRSTMSAIDVVQPIRIE